MFDYDNPIKAAETYLKYFPEDFNAKNNLKLYQYCKELELIPNDNYYPHISGYGRIEINNCITASKLTGDIITNSATNYTFDDSELYISWDSPCGRLNYVNEEFWHKIDAEWEELMNIFKSYKPLDYDLMNNHFIFDVENGKKFINDYDEIIKIFKNKINIKIKAIQLEKKKQEIEKLKAEIEEEITE